MDKIIRKILFSLKLNIFPNFNYYNYSRLMARQQLNTTTSALTLS